MVSRNQDNRNRLQPAQGRSMAPRVISEDELTEPIIRKNRVDAQNDATMRTVIDCGHGTLVTDEPVQHGGTGTGPSPLQTVLGALCGCEGVTFNRTASEKDFSYEGIDFEAAYSIDIRGRMGKRDVRAHFQTVRVVATVWTDESEDRLQQVVAETEARCPVFNLIRDAGVDVEMVWVRKET
jgi:uncharacterized OsmC-like protein